MKSGRLALAFGLLLPFVAAADVIVTQGLWRTRFGTDASFGLPAAAIRFPGVVTSGHFLVVSRQLTSTTSYEVCAFTVDGFWRSVRLDGSWGTSCRLFRYFSSSNNEVRDRCAVTSWNVAASSAGEWTVAVEARNDAADGDRFSVRLDAALEPPRGHETRLQCELVVSNRSGRAVSPANTAHRPLQEQWRILGFSSMYVADCLTPLPPWYNQLDPGHRYVGITNDAACTNDAWTPRFSRTVSPHDVKWIFTSAQQVGLDHSTSACPVVIVPDYAWYTQLVMRAVTSTTLSVRHAEDPARGHFIELREASGLCALSNLNWSVTFNRWDTNMVDGDGVQISLGLDDALPAWPAGAVQRLVFDLVAGRASPRVTDFIPAGSSHMLSWVHAPGSTVRLYSATSLAPTNWQLLAPALTNRTFAVPAGGPAGFYRLEEL